MLKTTQSRCGFTLLETIIYIGLFSAIFTGIFVSIYPLFTGAERLSSHLLRESEANFILAKIDYALSDSITSTEGKILIPNEGMHATELILGGATAVLYSFHEDISSTFCSPPRLCSFLTLATSSSAAFPLNNDRVRIENFNATHTAPSIYNANKRILDISFTVDGTLVGPVRYYLQF